MSDPRRAFATTDDQKRIVGSMLGVSMGPAVAWSPQALADLDRQRRKFAFWARWHPLPSRRAKYRAALAVLEGLQRGIQASRFYDQAIEMGRRYAASVAHGAGKK